MQHAIGLGESSVARYRGTVSKSKHLAREEILKGLTEVDQFLIEQDVIGEICIFGGACMCLAFSSRMSTKDVDAVFKPTGVMRKAIFEVGVANGWDWNWVNDDVAGFLSNTQVEHVEVSNLGPYKNLRVLFPKPEYMLAMKCLAGRSGTEEEPSPDLEDAIWLCLHLGLTKESEIASIIGEYYPDENTSDNTTFFISEIIDRLS